MTAFPTLPLTSLAPITATDLGYKKGWSDASLFLPRSACTLLIDLPKDHEPDIHMKIAAYPRANTAIAFKSVEANFLIWKVATRSQPSSYASILYISARPMKSVGRGFQTIERVVRPLRCFGRIGSGSFD